MKQKIIGIEFDKEEFKNVVKVEAPEGLFKKLKPNEKPDWQKMLEYCLGSENNYKKAEKELHTAMDNALPKNLKENCKFCKGESTEDKDKTCNSYYAQMQATFLLAVNIFCNTVSKNPHLKANRKLLQQLTVKFYSCLRLINGKGVLYFDLAEICKYCLHTGFLSLSQTFSNSDALKSISFINESLNKLKDNQIENELFNKEDYNFTDTQIKYFEKELEYHKNKVKYSSKTCNTNNKTTSNTTRPNRTDIAYYAYYSNEAKELNLTHPFPSDKAWQELGKQYNKTWKNIQQAYNKICNNKSERLKTNKKSTVTYVINNMLSNNSKAKIMAENELKTLLQNS